MDEQIEHARAILKSSLAAEAAPKTPVAPLEPGATLPSPFVLTRMDVAVLSCGPNSAIYTR